MFLRLEDISYKMNPIKFFENTSSNPLKSNANGLKP